ncbi:hypothetical protein GF361_02345 [Candidatus Woesearchaeota archaeon]|nr:hypothetical protein [Candidatus Woesearchaeota archaeon]
MKTSDLESRINDMETFTRLCKENGILNPEIYKDKSGRDTLVNSTKENKKYAPNMLGLDSFKLFYFEGKVIVDSKDFRSLKKKIAKRLDREKIDAITQDYHSINNEIRSFSNRLSGEEAGSLEFDELVARVDEFIQLRKEKGKISEMYNISMRTLTEKLADIFSKCTGNYNFKNSNFAFAGYSGEFGESAKSMFVSKGLNLFLTPTEELLEVRRVKELNRLKQKQEIGDFVEPFMEFYRNFFNLDYVNLAEEPKNTSDLLETLAEFKPSSVYIDHKKIAKEKQEFFTYLLYALPNGKKYLIEELGFISQRLEECSYNQSWDRQTWTRANLGIKPILNRLNSIAKEQGIDETIENMHYKSFAGFVQKIKFEKNLLTETKYAGLKEDDLYKKPTLVEV